jgi:hypothetical protein
LKLATDPIINVRIKFIGIIIELKKLWKYPVDRIQLEMLESISKKLLHDKDKDIFEMMQKVLTTKKH